ncbi:MAG: carboxypeptidase regulatory-like domain-containing protein [Candidatus Kapabacteria bacterium]|nr:carboxypeptidase regulatory-like domain-containing protein [Candidatus Kapabacteria bacterium]
MNALRFFRCMTIAPMLFFACLLVLAPQNVLEAQTRFGEDHEPKIPILKLKGNVSITRLNQINSPYQEANLSITPDGKRMFFMSDRGAQVWSRRPDTLDRFDGDIWVSERVNGEWQAPRCLDATVNTARGEDEPNISADGQAVIFQSWQPGWQNSGGPYYSAQMQGSKWAKPVGVGGGINLFFTQMRKQTGELYGTDGAAFSANGRLFVVACGPDYDGPMDLYFSRKAGKAGWLYCQKLDVSTDGNERSVHLAADGRTLYFASDGLGGFGGLDIFKATLNDDGTVTNITNIGEPFNTKADDYGFTASADGSEVYFIRNGDIFMAKLTSAFAALKPEPVAVVSGTVRSKSGNEPLIAKITFRGASEMDSEEVSTSDTGYYSAVLRVGKTYQQSITAPGHKEMKRVLSVPASQKSSALHADVVLLPQSK